MSCEDDLPALIRSTGRRYTRQRADVLAAVRHSDGHCTAEEIFTELSRGPTRMARSSVYRVLASLEQMGLVAALHSTGTDTVFEASEERGHHHLLCRDCGAVAELTLESLAELEEEIRQRTGFEPQIRHLGISGLCSECQARGEAGS